MKPFTGPGFTFGRQTRSASLIGLHVPAQQGKSTQLRARLVTHDKGKQVTYLKQGSEKVHTCDRAVFLKWRRLVEASKV